MLKHAASLCLAGAILLVCALTAASAFARGSLPDGISGLTAWSNQAVKEQLQKFPLLEQIAPTLLLGVGAKEQDGIFITENYLLENHSSRRPAHLPAKISRESINSSSAATFRQC